MATETTEEVKHAGGRPLKFTTVEQLESAINNYFLSCWDYKRDMFGNRVVDKDNPKNTKKEPAYIMVQTKPYTITGLAVAVGTTRDVLLDYEDKIEYSNTIKRAKEQCQAYAEESLFIGKNPAGAIFNLKNNYDRWRDKTEQEQTLVADVTSNGETISDRSMLDEIMQTLKDKTAEQA